MEEMMRKIIFCVLAALLVFAVFGCKDKQAAAPEAGEPQVVEVRPYEDQLYVEVSALNSLEYFYDHKEGMRLVGEDLGVKTEYTGPSDYDMNAVSAAIEQAVAKGAAGIVVVGWEESLNGAINSAIEQGVPVVTVDADLPTSNRLAFVGTSNFNAGVELGNWISDKLGGKGKVAMIGMPTLSNIRDRMDGVQSVFAGNDIEVVQIGDSKTDAVGSAQTAAEILLKFPDLDALIGIDSHSGLGIGTAIREAGKVGEVLATGFDRDNSLLELIEEGVVTATVVQRTALMPYYATLILWQLYNSEVALTKDDKAANVLNIPGFVDTGVMIVTQDTARSFIR
jgi:ribose transport system substrate-binding protein